MSRYAGLILLCCSTLYAASARSQQLPHVTAGAPVQLVVEVPSTIGVRPLPVEIKPGRGVSIQNEPTELLEGDDEITFTANLAPHVPPGMFAIATVIAAPPDGPRTAIHCYVWVRAPDAIAPVQPLPAPTALQPSAAGTEAPPPVTALPEASSSTPPTVLGARAPERPPSTLTGVAYAGATELGLRRRSAAETGFGIDLSGRLGHTTKVNALYIHGWNPGLSPVFRYGMHRSRGHLRIRAPKWSLEAGEIRPASPLTGGVVPSDGVSFQKTGGLLLGSLTAARPKYFAGGWGGHLFQGSIGLGFKHGSVTMFASDSARPVRSSGIIANTAPEEDSELVVEELERVGALLSRENRVRSGGLETRLRFGRHDLSARGGWVDLANPSNQRSEGAAATANYSFRSDRGSFSGQFRSSPRAPAGMAVAGDLLTLAGKVTLVGPLALIGRTYWQEASLLGRSSVTSGRGATAGLEYAQGEARFRLQGNYRESRYLSTTTTRSITAGFRLPMGVAGIDTAIEYGEANGGLRRRQIASYRGSVYAEGERASVMLSGSYRDYGLSSPRLSLDLSGSVEWGGATLEGGAGVSRAGIFGDVFNAWTTFEFPVPGDLTILLGADYDRWSYENSPYLIFLADDDTPPWRFTFNVRRKLSLPMPFVR